jgi:hypothetical protein
MLYSFSRGYQKNHLKKLIAKLTGFMITLINSTGIKIKAIKRCTSLGVILIRKVVSMCAQNLILIILSITHEIKQHFYALIKKIT